MRGIDRSPQLIRRDLGVRPDISGSACCDSSDCKLRLQGMSDFAYRQRIERHHQDPGHLRGHLHASPCKADDHTIANAFITKPFCQEPPRFAAIGKPSRRRHSTVVRQCRNSHTLIIRPPSDAAIRLSPYWMRRNYGLTVSDARRGRPDIRVCALTGMEAPLRISDSGADA